MEQQRLKDFLDRKVEEYNRASFIDNDPVLIPHLFSSPQDIEVAALFAALFAWGNRTTIINKSRELLLLMEHQPYQFCLHAGDSERRRLLHFKHRTFTATDMLYFVDFLQQHYQRHDSLEQAFSRFILSSDDCIEPALNGFHDYFFSLPDAPSRTRKHIASPRKKSTCKRLNMFLRWMVRRDDNGVDFGLWKNILPAQLVCPIDVHVARVARRFRLLQRNTLDWEAALELTAALRRLDPDDPVKYDFALFGLGAVEKF